MISICWLVISAIIGAVTIPMVRILGPIGIKNYVLEELYDSENGYYNVFYRIVSPTICSTVLVSLYKAFEIAVGRPVPSTGFLPLLFYWTFLAIIKISRGNLLSVPAFCLEAVASTGIAELINQFVVHRILNLDFDVIDNSNIAFQVEMAVLAFLVQFIVSLMIRRRYKADVEVGCSENNDKKGAVKLNTYSSVDVSEKRLYEYERRFGSLLPSRFSTDPLLRCVFFSIMAIEDANRPGGFRFLERIACRFGVAHSTGIMQQKSNAPLSDSESVVLAANYIEHMWDSFLVTFAKSVQSSYSSEIFSFTSLWYRYDYSTLADAVENAFGFFYGDYCGTRLLNASFVFAQVRRFWERSRYGFLPHSVISSWKESPAESIWFKEGRLYWESDHTISLVNNPTNCGQRKQIFFSGDADRASSEEVLSLIEQIQSISGTVIKVSLVENVFAIVLTCIDDDAYFNELKQGWTISSMDSM